jgi:hypothetical protein
VSIIIIVANGIQKMANSDVNNLDRSSSYGTECRLWRRRRQKKKLNRVCENVKAIARQKHANGEIKPVKCGCTSKQE